MKYITVTPAYGRDYKNKSEVLNDWGNGKDFVVNSYGGSNVYINKTDAENHLKPVQINVRYGKLRKVMSIKIE